MASAVYLENFLESIEHLPKELQRTFSLMKDLDTRTQDTMEEVESCVKDYKRNVAQTGHHDKKERLTRIDELYQKAKEYTDDKVQLAMQMYEMVDKHIRKLDADLGRFENELNLKDHGHNRRTSVSVGDEAKPTSNLTSRKRNSESGSTSIRRNNKKHASSSDETGQSSLTSPTQMCTPAGGPTDVLDMPVDPNEPTYCLCHQVSFGEMIGCDNFECPIEWFHFQCVGLTSKPKGKWYCPRCTQDREKNKKK